MREIYLDNAATTRAFPEVAELLAKLCTEDYGNPSSMHRKGVEAERYVREARETLARLLKCGEKNLLFTSGGTESDNLAILGAAYARARQGKHLITSQIEHPAVLQTMKHLEDEGFSVTYLPVNRAGQVDPEELQAAVTEKTTLVSLMRVNNEIGSIVAGPELGACIKRKNPNTLFHVDAVQSFGKEPIYPRREQIDLLSASGHKFHGPKGVGLLYIGDGVRLAPLSYGGGQQGDLRSGTLNVPGIAGMALAAKLLSERQGGETERLWALKRRLIDGALALEDVRVNGLSETGGVEGTDPHIVSLAFPGVRSEVLLHALEEEGIFVSAGSACATHKLQPSATLTAIGAPGEVLGSTLRFSFSIFTAEEEIDETLRILREKVPALRRFTRR